MIYIGKVSGPNQGTRKFVNHPGKTFHTVHLTALNNNNDNTTRKISKYTDTLIQRYNTIGKVCQSCTHGNNSVNHWNLSLVGTIRVTL